MPSIYGMKPNELEPIYQRILDIDIDEPLDTDTHINIDPDQEFTEDNFQNLIYALNEHNIEKVQQIIKQDPNVIYENVDFDNHRPYITPLHTAAETGYGVQFLVEQYKNRATLFSPASKWIDQENRDHHTPLTIACTKGHLSTVKYLLEHAGANPRATRPHILGFSISDRPAVHEPIVEVMQTKFVDILEYLYLQHYSYQELFDALDIHTHYKRCISIAAFVYVINQSFHVYRRLINSCKNQLSLWPVHKKELLDLALKTKLSEEDFLTFKFASK